MSGCSPSIGKSLLAAWVLVSDLRPQQKSGGTSFAWAILDTPGESMRHGCDIGTDAMSEDKPKPRDMWATRRLLWVSAASVLLIGATVLGYGPWWQQLLYLLAAGPLGIALIMVEIERSN